MDVNLNRRLSAGDGSGIGNEETEWDLVPTPSAVNVALKDEHNVNVNNRALKRSMNTCNDRNPVENLTRTHIEVEIDATVTMETTSSTSKNIVLEAGMMLKSLVDYHDNNLPKVIDALFDSLVQGHYANKRINTDNNTNYVFTFTQRFIHSFEHIDLIMFELFPRLVGQPIMQEMILDRMCGLLLDSVANILVCEQQKLLKRIVQCCWKSLENRDEMGSSSSCDSKALCWNMLEMDQNVREKLFCLLSIMGSHSASQHMLRLLCKPLRSYVNCKSNIGETRDKNEMLSINMNAVHVLNLLRSIMYYRTKNLCPNSYFHFDGRRHCTSALLLAGPEKETNAEAKPRPNHSRQNNNEKIGRDLAFLREWPTAGYTYCVFFRLEAFAEDEDLGFKYKQQKDKFLKRELDGSFEETLNRELKANERAFQDNKMACLLSARNPISGSGLEILLCGSEFEYLDKSVGKVPYTVVAKRDLILQTYGDGGKVVDREIVSNLKFSVSSDPNADNGGNWHWLSVRHQPRSFWKDKVTVFCNGEVLHIGSLVYPSSVKANSSNNTNSNSATYKKNTNTEEYIDAFADSEDGLGMDIEREDEEVGHYVQCTVGAAFDVDVNIELNDGAGMGSSFPTMLTKLRLKWGFSGQIARVALFSAVLNDAQLQSLYDLHRCPEGGGLIEPPVMCDLAQNSSVSSDQFEGALPGISNARDSTGSTPTSVWRSNIHKCFSYIDDICGTGFEKTVDTAPFRGVDPEFLQMQRDWAVILQRQTETYSSNKSEKSALPWIYLPRELYQQLVLSWDAAHCKNLISSDGITSPNISVSVSCYDTSLNGLHARLISSTPLSVMNGGHDHDASGSESFVRCFTKVLHTVSLSDVNASAGGLSNMLPLLLKSTEKQNPDLGPDADLLHAAVLARVVSLWADIISYEHYCAFSRIASQNQPRSRRGSAYGIQTRSVQTDKLISCLVITLTRCSPAMLTSELLLGLVSLLNGMSLASASSDIERESTIECLKLLFNFRIWCRANLDVQNMVFKVLHHQVNCRYNLVRKYIGVVPLLDSLAKYYRFPTMSSSSKSKDKDAWAKIVYCRNSIMGVVDAIICGGTLNNCVLMAEYLLPYIHVRVNAKQTGKTVPVPVCFSDVQHILTILQDESIESEQLVDILQYLISLLRRGSKQFSSHFGMGTQSKSKGVTAELASTRILSRGENETSSAKWGNNIYLPQLVEHLLGLGNLLPLWSALLRRPDEEIRNLTIRLIHVYTVLTGKSDSPKPLVNKHGRISIDAPDSEFRLESEHACYLVRCLKVSLSELPWTISSHMELLAFIVDQEANITGQLDQSFGTHGYVNSDMGMGTGTGGWDLDVSKAVIRFPVLLRSLFELLMQPSTSNMVKLTALKQLSRMLMSEENGLRNRHMFTRIKGWQKYLLYLAIPQPGIDVVSSTATNNTSKSAWRAVNACALEVFSTALFHRMVGISGGLMNSSSKSKDEVQAGLDQLSRSSSSPSPSPSNLASSSSWMSTLAGTTKALNSLGMNMNNMLTAGHGGKHSPNAWIYAEEEREKELEVALAYLEAVVSKTLGGPSSAGKKKNVKEGHICPCSCRLKARVMFRKVTVSRLRIGLFCTLLTRTLQLIRMARAGDCTASAVIDKTRSQIEQLLNFSCEEILRKENEKNDPNTSSFVFKCSCSCLCNCIKLENETEDNISSNTPGCSSCKCVARNDGISKCWYEKESPKQRWGENEKEPLRELQKLIILVWKSLDEAVSRNPNPNNRAFRFKYMSAEQQMRERRKRKLSQDAENKRFAIWDSILVQQQARNNDPGLYGKNNSTSESGKSTLIKTSHSNNRLPVSHDVCFYDDAKIGIGYDSAFTEDTMIRNRKEKANSLVCDNYKSNDNNQQGLSAVGRISNSDSDDYHKHGLEKEDSISNVNYNADEYNNATKGRDGQDLASYNDEDDRLTTRYGPFDSKILEKSPPMCPGGLKWQIAQVMLLSIVQDTVQLERYAGGKEVGVGQSPSPRNISNWVWCVYELFEESGVVNRNSAIPVKVAQVTKRSNVPYESNAATFQIPQHKDRMTAAEVRAHINNPTSNYFPNARQAITHTRNAHSTLGSPFASPGLSPDILSSLANSGSIPTLTLNAQNQNQNADSSSTLTPKSTTSVDSSPVVLPNVLPSEPEVPENNIDINSNSHSREKDNSFVLIDEPHEPIVLEDIERLQYLLLFLGKTITYALSHAKIVTSKPTVSMVVDTECNTILAHMKRATSVSTEYNHTQVSNNNTNNRDKNTLSPLEAICNVFSLIASEFPPNFYLQSDSENALLRCDQWLPNPRDPHAFSEQEERTMQQNLRRWLSHPDLVQAAISVGLKQHRWEQFSDMRTVSMARKIVLSENEKQKNLERACDELEIVIGPFGVNQYEENLRKREIVRTSHEYREKAIRQCRLLLGRLASLPQKGIWWACENHNYHWSLDTTENAYRMRVRLKRTYGFGACSTDDESHPADDKQEGLSLEKIPEMFPPKNIFDTMSDVEDGNHTEHTENVEVGMDFHDHNNPESANVSTEWDVVELASVHYAARNEKVIHSTECELVLPMSVVSGRMDITASHIYFYGDVTSFPGQRFPHKSKNNTVEMGTIDDGSAAHIDLQACDDEISIDVTWWAQDIEDLDSSTRQRRWAIKDVIDIQMRRHLLRPSGIEIFLSNRKNFMFNFRGEKQNLMVFKTIVEQHPPNLFSHNVTGLASATASIKMKTRPKPKLYRPIDLVQVRYADITERWRRRQVSNFEYLMHLNTCSGRTYNDLTQYPVFPWVLSDYVSESLDLNDEKMYRDLSKPIGALNPKRLQHFLERQALYEPVGGHEDMMSVPPFLYGSHYSTVGSVLYYLLRLEPFSKYAKVLQGNKFDHADRLFHDVKETWENCLNSPSDLKEVTPEWYYLPEMFYKRKSLHLGERQNGTVLGDVILPVWANNSPEKFVSINRRALESEYVSNNLHNWIDLIFGYKQRGQAAQKAHNTFYYLTYEGSVDLESIHDEVQRKGFESQIANFGQTPAQLFSRPHPSRYPIHGDGDNSNEDISHGHNLDKKSRSKNGNESNLLESSKVDEPFLDERNRQGFNSEAGHDLVIDVTAVRLYRNWIDGPLENFCIIANGNCLLTCGHSDSTLKLWSCKNGTLMQNIHHHNGSGVVTAVAADDENRLIATGTEDGVITVWHFTHPEITTASINKPYRFTSFLRGEKAGPTLPINNTPKEILTGCHDHPILSLDILAEVDTIVSVSATSVHVNTCRGEFIRTFPVASNLKVHRTSLTRLGRIICFSSSSCTADADEDDVPISIGTNVQVYSINGELLWKTQLEGKLQNFVRSKMGEILYVATSKGVKMLDIERRFTTLKLMDIDAKVDQAAARIILENRDGYILVKIGVESEVGLYFLKIMQK